VVATDQLPLVMGLDQKITWVGSIFCGSGQVGSAIYGLGLNFKISPKNIKFLNFFPSDQIKLLWVGSESTRVEAGSASYLLRVKSKLGSGL